MTVDQLVAESRQLPQDMRAELIERIMHLHREPSYWRERQS